MQEKQYTSPIIVILGIILLAIPIVCPPLFRVLFPKEEKVPEVVNYSSILTCSRDVVISKYKITYKTTFDNGKATDMSGSFMKTDYPQETIDASDPNMVPVDTEFNYFKGFETIVMNENEGNYTFTLTANELPAEGEDNGLRDYFKGSIKEQQQFYEDRGFSCSLVEL